MSGPLAGKPVGLYDIPASEFAGLSTRAYNALRRSGVSTTGELKRMTEEDIRGLRTIGEVGLEEVIRFRATL